jgi:hypothetical protein
MTGITEYQIQDLAKDNLAWRVDWFGTVTYAERYRRTSQPMIEIQFSQISDVLPDIDELSTLKNEQCPRIKQIRLPVGLLPLFKIGDIWRNGKLTESPDYDLAHFDRLAVGRQASTLIKAGLPDTDSGKYYLPISHHPYHMRHTQSYCVHVKTGSCSLIIPSTELIRFYFGSSSTLISRIFDAPFSQENFWVSTEDHHSRTPKIHLSPGISGRSASDIGRIAFSKAARAAAEIIGNSCIAATAREERAYPKGIFPFEGETDLAVSGKWLPFDGNDHGVFLVFKLISCSHPFPFATLRYTSERTGQSNKKSQVSSTTEGQRDEKDLRFSKARQETKTIIDEEPDKTKKPRGIGLSHAGVQFTDLTRKAISKIESDQVPTLLLSKEGISIIAGSSVGDAGRTPTVQPIEFSGVTDENVASAGKNAAAGVLTTQLFFCFLSNIFQSDQYISIDIIRLDPRQRFDYLSTMPRILDEDGEVSSMCVISNPGSEFGEKISTRNRRISIGRATSIHSSVYFMVPESLQATNHVEYEIELHIIVDRSKSIRTNPDLLAAIAVHFSSARQIEKANDLGHGTISMIFRTAHSGRNEQATTIAELLYQNAQPFLTFANAPNCDEESMTGAI